MMAGAHGDALGVEERRHVVRVQSVDAERDDGAALARRSWPIQGDAGKRGKLGQGLARQLAAMLGDPLHAELLEILDRRGEADGLRDWRRAGLEPPWDIVPDGPLAPALLDHLPAAPPP